MATSEKKKTSNNLIDPIYTKFSRSILRALGSTEFYEYFMDSISRAKNEFQFSNRKLEKLVDLSWVDAIEESLEGFQNIINNPRNIIREEEIIVNVANAKKAGPDVVRHLAQHGSLVENYDPETGNVRPSKLMQKIREDSTDLYENRLVFTVLEHTYNFVKIRHRALFDAMSEEYGAKLKVHSNLESAKELIHVDMFLHIKEKESALEVDEKNREVFDRISRIYRLLTSFMNSQFAEQMKQINRVRGNITKTNVLKKNPDYKKIVKLWEFLHKYEDVGYMIKVTEQNPVIDESFQQDIFHNIMFQYIILKRYLEDESDREVSKPLKNRKRTLKPKVIKQIIEELTEDYDVPDLEIRKVLIEELTKEQLLLEEKAEQDRLIAEALQRKKEEEERIRQEKEAEEEKLRQERQEKERQELQDRMEQELEDRRRSEIFRKEIQYFESKKMSRLQLRQDENDKLLSTEPVQDYADAALRMMQIDQQKWEAQERIRIRKEEEEARKRRKEEEAQIAKDMVKLGVYLEEVQRFKEVLEIQKQERASYEESFRLAFEQAKLEIQAESRNKQGSKRRFGSR